MNILGLHRFKNFGAPVTMNLKPLTLIFGDNSSGKSSIIQALMLLKQTLESAVGLRQPLLFRSRQYLDLGSFSNIITSHDTSALLELTIGSMLPNMEKPDGELLSQFGATTTEMATASLAIQFAANEAQIVSVREVSIQMGPHVAFTFREASDSPSESEADDTYGAHKSLTPAQRHREFALADINMQSPFMQDALARCQKGLRERIGQLWEASRILEQQLSETRSDLPSPFRDAYFEARDFAAARILRYETDYGMPQFAEDYIASWRSRRFRLNHFLLFGNNMGGMRSLSIGEQVHPLTGASSEGFFGEERVIAMTVGTHESMFYKALPDPGTIVSDLSSQISRELFSASYLGPLRESPSRTYIFSGDREAQVGTRGENAPNVLFSNRNAVAAVNAYAKRMQLGYSISIHDPSDTRLDSVFSIRLTDVATGDDVGLSDVGFGVSQVLPILLECSLPGRRLVFIEQPEIHLNPRLQAELGEVFVDSIRKNRGRKQFIVETHSEHLLLRIGNCIRKKLISASDVAVLYVSKGAGGSYVREMPLNADGDRIDPWPDDFFDDTYRELFSTP